MGAVDTEIVGVLDGEPSLDRAVAALETNGFNRAAVSLLGPERTVIGRLGQAYGRVQEVADDPRTPRGNYFSPISRLEAVWLPAPALAMMATLLMVGISAGGRSAVIAGVCGAILGALFGVTFHFRHRRRLREQLGRGGLLLWIRVGDALQERMAREILEAFAARDIHTLHFPGS